MTEEKIEALAAGYQFSPPLRETQTPKSTHCQGRIFQDATSLCRPSAPVDIDRIQAIAEVSPVWPHIRSAPKCLSTENHVLNVKERLNVAIIKRIEELENAKLWSLRQPMKQPLPPRPHAHWDYMLKEMEWLSTDFYEERKFKIAAACLLSRAIRQYFDSSDKEQLRHEVWVRPGDILTLSSGLEGFVFRPYVSRNKLMRMTMC